MKLLKNNLLLSRDFSPIFIVQFLGAFSDNVFRFSLLTLFTYRLSEQLGYSAAVLNIVAAGIFILPFFLFSATGGVLADRFNKRNLIRVIKLGELFIITFGAFAFLQQNIWFLLVTLFMTGIQSALFGPVKYSILPSILPNEKLIHANALVEAGTFLSILVGTLLGSLLVLTSNGLVLIALILIATSVSGVVASFYIPSVPSDKQCPAVRFNIFKETWDVIRIGAEEPKIGRVILAISWFWFLGFVLQSQMTPLAKEVLFADEQVFSLFLVLFTLGIAIGSMICYRVLGKQISAHLVPYAGVIISLLCIDLYFALSAYVVTNESLAGVSEFVMRYSNWRILFDMFAIAIAAGFYIVPLYTLIQSRSESGFRSRVIAANNISNAAFMVLATLLVLFVFKLGFEIPDLFWMLAIINGLVVMMILQIVMKQTMRSFGRFLFKVLYRVRVTGFDNIPDDDRPIMYVANHTSYLDGPLLMCLLPGKLVFAINTTVNKQWWARMFTRYFDVCPLDPSNPIALRNLVKTLRSGSDVMIFPEGRITVTGGLMKLYEGPGKIADMTNAHVVPVHIEGAHRTAFSKLKGLVKQRWFPKISITIHLPTRLDVSKEIKGKARRQRLKMQMVDVLNQSTYMAAERNYTLLDQLKIAAKEHGSKFCIIEDAQQNVATYSRLLIASSVLANKLRSWTGTNPNVGIMLPNTVGAVAAYFALHRLEKVPAMINFTAGIENINACLQFSQIETVVTSRKFIEFAGLEELMENAPANVKWIYLEDIREKVSSLDKVWALLKCRWDRLFTPRPNAEKACQAATILYTSGSEGVPKGVVLSHYNILSNHAQVNTCVDFNSLDKFFNALPMFHSFGLTVATLLPVLSGYYCYLYPSPLHFKMIPELVYEKRATVLAGTDSFLNGYGRKADSEDFQTLRYAIAGAEKLKDTTRTQWIEKFGIRIHEGYGVTETSPALSVNTYSQYKKGSVGRLLPGMEYRLESVEGVQGGRLFIKGDNVMMGYLKYDRPGELQPLSDGWYDTGDIVDVDENRFITILGRAKRFAKIAGEMVSLASVESYISRNWPDHHHCACAVRDERRGEVLVLVTEADSLSRKQLQDVIVAGGGTELMVPRKIVVTPAMPLLGSGKLDFGNIQKLAEAG